MEPPDRSGPAKVRPAAAPRRLPAACGCRGNGARNEYWESGAEVRTLEEKLTQPEFRREADEMLARAQPWKRRFFCRKTKKNSSSG